MASSTIRALVQHRLDDWRDAKVEAIAPLRPGFDEVLIATKAASLNFADLLMMEGKYQHKAPLPFIPRAIAYGILRVPSVAWDGRLRAEPERAPESEGEQNGIGVRMANAPVRLVPRPSIFSAQIFPICDSPAFIPGRDAAGTVLAVGDQVRGFARGDRVVATPNHGAFAEQTIASARVCHKISAGVSFEDAAACGTGIPTIVAAISLRARLKPGE